MATNKKRTKNTKQQQQQQQGPILGLALSNNDAYEPIIKDAALLGQTVGDIAAILAEVLQRMDVYENKRMLRMIQGMAEAELKHQEDITRFYYDPDSDGSVSGQD
jgi:hypothetical protein